MRPTSAAAIAAVLVLVGCASPEPQAVSDSPASTEDASPVTSAPPTSTPTSTPVTSAPPEEPTTSPSRRPARRRGTVITTRSSDFGPMLFDGTGQAIYLFDKETGPRPACYGACAEAWPPVLTTGTPRPTGDVRRGLLDTVQRRDGNTQVTYAGHPLYYYAHEAKGQVLCHDVVEYGGLWLVVTPRGTPAA